MSWDLPFWITDLQYYMGYLFDSWNEIFPYFREVFLNYNFKYLFWPTVFIFFRNPSYAFVGSPLHCLSIFLNSFLSLFLFGFVPFSHFNLCTSYCTSYEVYSLCVSCSLVFISEMFLSFSSSSFLRSISSHLLSSYLFQELLQSLYFCFLVFLQAGITFFSAFFVLIVFNSCCHFGLEFLFVLWRYFYSDASFYIREHQCAFPSSFM